MTMGNGKVKSRVRRKGNARFPIHLCCPGRPLNTFEQSLGNMGFPGGSDSKESACQCRTCGFNPWVRKIPWRRQRQPASVFLPEDSHGQRNLVGCSPQDHRVRHDWATNNYLLGNTSGERLFQVERKWVQRIGGNPTVISRARICLFTCPFIWTVPILDYALFQLQVWKLV